jgi:hypothetical protein
MKGKLRLRRVMMTKAIMQQYEIVRSSGACNMFNYGSVMDTAMKLGLIELASVDRDGYKDILMNFDKYMKKFDIKQGGQQ